MKSLRLKKRWSQEQLAHLSDLNVRTIQRVEKGDNVGVETLKSLAAVFEISIDELVEAINHDNQLPQHDNVTANTIDAQRQKAKDKVKSIKYFYGFSAFLLIIFLLFMLPNYNDGENLAALVVVFLCFVGLIGALALVVFQPFGDSWENKKIKQILGAVDLC